MHDDTILRPSPAAVFRPLDAGGVVLDVTTGAYFELNASGRFLWEQMVPSGILEEALVNAASARNITRDGSTRCGCASSQFAQEEPGRF